MKLSKYTLSILKNFAKIRQSILIREGSGLITKNETGNMMAYAAVDDFFPQNCCIFDLNVFLQILSMFHIDEVELDFNKEYVEIGNNETKVKYFLANEAIYEDMNEKIPSTKPKLNEPTFRLDLSAEEIAGLTKGLAVLSLDTISISPNGVRAYSTKSGSSNDYTLNKSAGVDVDATAIIDGGLLDLYAGDYTINVHHEYNCVHFVNKTYGELEYYIMYKQLGASEV